MTSKVDARRDGLLAAGLLALGSLVYALVVVQDFSGPLIGVDDYDGAFRGDANYFELLGTYVRDHWHFGLRPISFFTKEVAYPLGTHIGLLSWCAERDLLVAALLHVFGPGPWIQLYVVASATLGAVGVTAILRLSVGFLRASLVGFAGSFMSFYAWYKYPYHLNISVLHWMLMSIAADAVMMRLVVEGKRLSSAFVLFRAALIVLCIGLDLGYVAGLALTSFVVTTYCAWSHLGLRDRRLLGRIRLALPVDAVGEVRARPLPAVGALLLLTFGLLFYLPFVLAVVRDTAAYPMNEAAGIFTASPLHALLPYLPGVHPNSSLVHTLFGSDEGIGEFTPGYTLLVVAAVGLTLAHRRGQSALVKPLLITAVLVLAFHPRWCKTLQVFPWFAYNRVAGRGTVALPLLFALIGSQFDRWPRPALISVALLGVAEFATGAFLVSAYRPARLEKKHAEYFETIAASPGEALLEWPFCIAGANGVATKELCPYYGRNATAYANRRFHRKATVSFYLSRMHVSQIQSWLDDGWPDMFSPDDATREHATRETTCFTDEKWARFERLYRGNDFAGIQLYVDLLPGVCVEAFHRRYGEPKAHTTLPRFGRVEFFGRASPVPTTSAALVQ